MDLGGALATLRMDADLRSLAERDTFLLVYPQGSCIEGYSHWNTCPTEEEITKALQKTSTL